MRLFRELTTPETPRFPCPQSQLPICGRTVIPQGADDDKVATTEGDDTMASNLVAGPRTCQLADQLSMEPLNR